MKTGINNLIIKALFLGVFGLTPVVSSALYFQNTSNSNCFSQITSTLQAGDENNDVYTLQQYLANSGYLQASPNGYFGSATQNAVLAFQSSNGLSGTGVVDYATKSALNTALCGASSSYGNTLGNYNNTSVNVNTGITYVDSYDAYTSSPYSNTQSTYATTYPTNSYSPVVNTAVPAPVALPTNVSNQIASTNIIYNSAVGYTYGIVPQAGSLTVTSPYPNSTYNPGDTVNVNWNVNNITVTTGYQVILDNTSSGQSKVVAYTTGNNASFVLSQETLDAICSGDCASYGRNSYRVNIVTPITDIAGITSNFKASVSPITINRPFGLGTVSITPSKTPVNTGELFKLYVNIPTGASWDSGIYGRYAFKIHALCTNSGVQVSIAGVTCGQDFTLPFSPSYLQQEIPVIISNSTWFKQDVTFELIVTNLSGQVIGTSQAHVFANGSPFSW
jgi:peptidoglycan hydrolase-like protein with peptidoglycan-binding domain